LVLVRTIASREIIIAASDAARAKSIRPGMTLGEAKALYADVLHAEHDAYRDAVALEALARWMMRFSPVVAVVNRDVEGEASSAERKDGLFLDVTGCERVFGGLDELLRQVREALRGIR